MKSLAMRSASPSSSPQSLQKQNTMKFDGGALLKMQQIVSDDSIKQQQHYPNFAKATFSSSLHAIVPPTFNQTISYEPASYKMLDQECAVSSQGIVVE